MRIHIACENVDFLWTKEEVKAFEQLWRAGVRDMHELAKHFRRTVDDIAFLIYDRAHLGYISRGAPVEPSEKPKPNQPKRSNRSWDVKKLKRLYDQNKTQEQIVAAMGMHNKHTLRCLLYRLRKEEPKLWAVRDVDRRKKG